MESRSLCRGTIISTLMLISIIGSGIIIACTKPPKIDSVKKEPNGDQKFGDLEEPDWIPDYEETATMIANIPKETLSKYVNTNAVLEYSFEFLTFEKQGDIVFNGDSAQIEIDGIPIGQAGALKIEILEDGTAKLVGTKEGVTFKKGKNNQSIDLRKVEGNGNDGTDDESDDSDQDEEDKASLILTLNIKDSQSENEGDDNGNSGGASDFATKILPLARSYCTDCHAKFGLAAPDSEQYFAARKSSLTSRLSKSASNTMPQRGSQEAQRMSDDDREVFIAYIKSL